MSALWHSPFLTPPTSQESPTDTAWTVPVIGPSIESRQSDSLAGASPVPFPYCG